MLCKQRRAEWSTSFIIAYTGMLYSSVRLCDLTTLLSQAEWGSFSPFGAERERMTWEAPREQEKVQLKKFMVMGNSWVDRTTSEYVVVQGQWTYSMFSLISLVILRQFVGCMSLIGRLWSPKSVTITVPQSPASHSTTLTPRHTPTPTLNTYHFLEACWNRVKGQRWEVILHLDTFFCPSSFSPPFCYSFILTLLFSLSPCSTFMHQSGLVPLFLILSWWTVLIYNLSHANLFTSL